MAPLIELIQPGNAVTMIDIQGILIITTGSMKLKAKEKICARGNAS